MGVTHLNDNDCKSEVIQLEKLRKDQHTLQLIFTNPLLRCITVQFMPKGLNGIQRRFATCGHFFIILDFVVDVVRDCKSCVV